MTILPFFKTADERDNFIISHADNFSVIRFIGRAKYKKEMAPSLPEAEALAKRMVKAEGGQWMIYAIYGIYDALVKVVNKETQ